MLDFPSTGEGIAATVDLPNHVITIKSVVRFRLSSIEHDGDLGLEVCDRGRQLLGSQEEAGRLPRRVLGPGLEALYAVVEISQLLPDCR